MDLPSHPLWFNHPSNTGRATKSVKPLHKQFSSPSTSFLLGPDVLLISFSRTPSKWQTKMHTYTKPQVKYQFGVFWCLNPGQGERFPLLQDCPEWLPSVVQTGVLSRGKLAGVIKLTAHLKIMPWLQMSRAVPLLLHDVQWDSSTFGIFTVSDSERDHHHIC